jgi:hypothetical protein
VGVHGGRRPGHGEEAAVWADSGLGLGAVGIDGNDGNDTPVVGPGCVGELTGLTQIGGGFPPLTMYAVQIVL